MMARSWFDATRRMPMRAEITVFSDAVVDLEDANR